VFLDWLTKDKLIIKIKTKKMTKEEITSLIGKPLTRPIGFIQGLFLLSFIASPFLWIWIDWTTAWKVGLTGLLGTIILYWIDKIVRKTISNVVDSEMAKMTESKPKSRFQEKLEKMAQERKQST